jgi:hypothetical protein
MVAKFAWARSLSFFGTSVAAQVQLEEASRLKEETFDGAHYFR